MGGVLRPPPEHIHSTGTARVNFFPAPLFHSRFPEWLKLARPFGWSAGSRWIWLPRLFLSIPPRNQHLQFQMTGALISPMFLFLLVLICSTNLSSPDDTSPRLAREAKPLYLSPPPPPAPPPEPNPYNTITVYRMAPPRWDPVRYAADYISFQWWMFGPSGWVFVGPPNKANTSPFLSDAGYHEFHYPDYCQLGTLLWAFAWLSMGSFALTFVSQRILKSPFPVIDPVLLLKSLCPRFYT